MLSQAPDAACGNIVVHADGSRVDAMHPAKVGEELRKKLWAKVKKAGKEKPQRFLRPFIQKLTLVITAPCGAIRLGSKLL